MPPLTRISLDVRVTFAGATQRQYLNPGSNWAVHIAARAAGMGEDQVIHDWIRIGHPASSWRGAQVMRAIGQDPEFLRGTEHEAIARCAARLLTDAELNAMLDVRSFPKSPARLVVMRWSPRREETTPATTTSSSYDQAEERDSG